MDKCSVIIPCAGSGSRFGGSTPKQYLPLAGKPVLGYSLTCFEQLPEVSDIIIPADSSWHSEIMDIARRFAPSKTLHLVAGGSERQFSIANALEHPAIQSSDYIMVHDAARPFITLALLQELLALVRLHNAVIPVLPVKDTVKKVSTHKFITTTLLRSELVLVQTPQVFSREVLLSAYRNAHEQGIIGTDDSSLVEATGTEVFTCTGLESNIKITTVFDWSIAELLSKQQ